MTRTILVADDSPTIQRQASGILIAEGMEVVSVCNGVAAIKKLPTVKPLLILADVSMPGKDGYEVCEFVKTSAELRHIPVLLTCSEFEPYREDRGNEVRADGCVKKPFNHDDLIAAVTKFLAQSERAQLTAPSAAPLSAAPESIPSAELGARTPEPEAHPEFDFTSLSEGVALTEPLEESTRGILAQEGREEISATDAQAFQSQDIGAAALVQEEFPVSEEPNSIVEESEEVSASSGPVEGKEFRDPDPVLAGTPTIFHASEETARQSEDDSAVPIPALENDREALRPETVYPSVLPPDLADRQQASVPAGAPSEQPGMSSPEFVAEVEPSAPQPEAVPAIEESLEEPVADTAQPCFTTDKPQFAPISNVEELEEISGPPPPPEPQASSTLQAEPVEHELEGKQGPSLANEVLEPPVAELEQPDPEAICAIVRKVVVRMSPPALGPEVIEDIVRQITSELTAEFGSHSSGI